MTIYLASQSPRRWELCKQIGLSPTILRLVDVDETALPRESPRLYASRMAQKKSIAARQSLISPQQGDVIVTADTVVCVGRRILHKTQDRVQAEDYLSLLSGRNHRVYGGLVVAVWDGAVWQERGRVSETRIKFSRLSAQQIAAYLDRGQWQGCAGGYAIQGIAAKFVAQINGSYSNVVGVDLYHLSRLLPD